MKNPETFQLLFRTYGPELQRMAAYSRNTLLADAVQTLWCDLWENRSYKRGKHAGRHYLAVLADMPAPAQRRAVFRRLLSNLLMEKRKVRSNPSDPTVTLAAQSAKRSASETRRMVRELLEDLPADERKLLVDSYIGGYNQTELAEQLGVSQPRIAQKLANAKVTLRRTNRRLCAE